MPGVRWSSRTTGSMSKVIWVRLWNIPSLAQPHVKLPTFKPQRLSVIPKFGNFLPEKIWTLLFNSSIPITVVKQKPPPRHHHFFSGIPTTPSHGRFMAARGSHFIIGFTIRITPSICHYLSILLLYISKIFPSFQKKMHHHNIPSLFNHVFTRLSSLQLLVEESMDPEVLPATNIIKVGIQPAKNGWFTRQNSKFQLQKTGVRRVRPFRMGKITPLNKDMLLIRWMHRVTQLIH